MKQEHILFLTGKLAENALHKILAAIQPDFTYSIKQMGVSVAALMTDMIIRKRLAIEEALTADRIMIPGRCQIDVDSLSKHFNIPLEFGPEELKDLPLYFNRKKITTDLKNCNTKIFAEIYNAPKKTTVQILLQAKIYRDAGADVIDIGCLPDTPFPHLEEVVQTLCKDGFTVSIDSLNPEELLRGSKKGASYLLSLSENTLWVAEQTPAIPVLIPSPEGGLASLKRAIAKMETMGKPYIADPILNPIHCGFIESLLLYSELRKEFPNMPFLMGIGNITELLDADTLGVNTLLMAMVSEIGNTHILTSQVNLMTRTNVQEINAARRIMYMAHEFATVPQGFGDDLIALHEKDPFPYNQTEINEIAAAIKDPSYRIQITQEAIHIFNRDGIHSAKDPFTLLPKLQLDGDVSHAFYLGYELAKAKIARELGKRFVQDQELNWGCVSKG